MRFLPFEDFTFKTHLKNDALMSKLSHFVNPGEIFQYYSSKVRTGKSYAGQVGADWFTIRRIVGYRNSFAPIITGEIHQNTVGSTIKIKMRLHRFVIIFLSFWCGLAGLNLLGSIPALLTINFFKQNFSTLATALPLTSYFFPGSMFLSSLIMIIFIYALTMLSFMFESNKAKVDLQKLFEAEII